MRGLTFDADAGDGTKEPPGEVGISCLGSIDLLRCMPYDEVERIIIDYDS